MSWDSRIGTRCRVAGKPPPPRSCVSSARRAAVPLGRKGRVERRSNLAGVGADGRRDCAGASPESDYASGAAGHAAGARPSPRQRKEPPLHSNGDASRRRGAGVRAPPGAGGHAEFHHGLTGWRIGYGAGPRELIAAMAKVQSQTTSGASSISQWAGVEALDGDQAFIGRSLTVFRTRRDVAVSRLGEANGLPAARRTVPSVSTSTAEASSANAHRPGASSTTTATSLLSARDEEVAVVHGEAFGLSPYFGVSYALAPIAWRKRVVVPLTGSSKSRRTAGRRLAGSAARQRDGFSLAAPTRCRPPRRRGRGQPSGGRWRAPAGSRRSSPPRGRRGRPARSR